MHSVKASTWLTNNPKKGVNSMCWYSSGFQAPRPVVGVCGTLESLWEAGNLGEDCFAVRSISGCNHRTGELT